MSFIFLKVGECACVSTVSQYLILLIFFFLQDIEPGSIKKIIPIGIISINILSSWGEGLSYKTWRC